MFIYIYESGPLQADTGSRHHRPPCRPTEPAAAVARARCHSTHSPSRLAIYITLTGRNYIERLHRTCDNNNNNIKPRPTARLGLDVKGPVDPICGPHIRIQLHRTCIGRMISPVCTPGELVCRAAAPKLGSHATPYPQQGRADCEWLAGRHIIIQKKRLS